MKISKERLTALRTLLNEHGPEEFIILDAVCNSISWQISTQRMHMELEGHTEEEIKEAIKPKVDYLNELLERRKGL